MAGKKYGLDDKYNNLYKSIGTLPKASGNKNTLSINPMQDDLNKLAGMSSALGLTSKFAQRASTLRVGKPSSANLSKKVAIGAGGAGGIGAGMAAFDEVSDSDEFKEGRKEGAKAAAEKISSVKKSIGKVTGYLTGKKYGGSMKKMASGGKVMKASSGKAVSLKEVYALANRNKSKDRLTEMDIKQAEKVLGYKKALPEIKADGAKYGKFMKKEKKIKKVMGEYKKGELNIGKSKKKVKSRKQAIAIALSEARKKKA